MSIATAARLFEEFCDGTAEKDWRAWAEEALSLIEHRIPPEGRRERVAFYEEAMRDAKNHAALALELAYLREKADAPVSGEAATLLRIWQSNLGASRNQCDEPGRKLWDRIEAALGVMVCATEQDCTGMPWCRINGKCQRTAGVEGMSK